MYICVCHALSESDITAAIDTGEKCEKDVFAAFGVRPECGQCVQKICQMMNRMKEGDAASCYDRDKPPSCSERSPSLKEGA